MDYDTGDQMNNVDAAISYLTTMCGRTKGIAPQLCDPVLFDLRFAKGYGSKADTEHSHHAYPGGLAVHTAEVMSTALNTAESMAFQPVDTDVLTVAALWHDYAKIHDYDNEGKGTEYRDKIRHVVGSYQYFMRTVDEIYDFPPEFYSGLIMDVGHCILSHHGRKEWGSPVEPQTLEAQILHFADMLSMQYGRGRTNG